jgi:hypothetical protein
MSSGVADLRVDEGGRDRPVAGELAAKILRNPRRGVESAKETILEVSGRPLDD